MSVTDTEVRTTQTAGTRGRSRTAVLVAVVGYDGSEPSRRALSAATQLIAGRDGHVEVVYVAHVTTSAGMSAQSGFGVNESFDEVQRELSLEVRNILGDVEARWHFQRRDGSIAHELIMAADDLRRENGDDATIVIVVGSSMHRYHHIMGSIPVSLARQAEFPLLVVPWVQTAA